MGHRTRTSQLTADRVTTVGHYDYLDGYFGYWRRGFVKARRTSDPAFPGLENDRYVVDAPSTTRVNLGSTHEVIAWSPNKRPAWNSCYHEKTSLTHKPGTYSETVDVDAFCRHYPGYLTGSAFTKTITNYVPSNLPSVSIPNPREEALDWRRAWEALLDDAYGLMPDDISVMVNIAEFSSLKRLVPQISGNIRNILKYVKHHPNKKVRTWKYLYDKSGRRIPWTGVQTTTELSSLTWCLRDLANTHLAGMFGVLPLAHDVANWTSKFFEVQARLKEFAFIADGQPHVLHASTPAVNDESEESGTFKEGTRSGRFNRNASFKSQGTITAVCQVQKRPWSEQVRNLTNQITGVNVPLQVVWDLVPFSFVVDWFLPVGETIKRIEPRRLIGGLARDVVITNVMHSIKTTSIDSLNWELAESTWDHTLVTHYHAVSGSVEGRRELYTRSLRMPVLNWLPRRKTRFGLGQVLLSASLTVQRLIKR